MEKRTIADCYHIESGSVEADMFVLTFVGRNNKGRPVSFRVQMKYYMFGYLIKTHLIKIKRNFAHCLRVKLHNLHNTTLDD